MDVFKWDLSCVGIAERWDKGFKTVLKDNEMNEGTILTFNSA